MSKPIKSKATRERERRKIKLLSQYNKLMEVPGSEKTAVMKEVAKKNGYQSHIPVYKALKWAEANNIKIA